MKNMALSKNQIIKLEITSMSSEGVGIGRNSDNIVIFVPNSAIGDLLLVKILKVNKSLAYGKVEEVLEKSGDRIPVDCDVFNKCGGCVYRHISYDSELKIKKQKVYDAIKRIGKIENVEVDDVVFTEKVDFYRNKAMIPVAIQNDELCMGFYSKHSHRINNCLSCKLSNPVFNLISKKVYDFLSLHKDIVYSETTNKGYFRHLYLRIAEAANEVMVCFVINGRKFPYMDELVKLLLDEFKMIKTILINVNTKKTNVVLGSENIVLFGDGYITDKLCGLNFRISPQSFYQVNRDATEILYSLAKKYANLSSDDVVLDLYCGTGTIGLSLASSCKEVIGIEIIDKAINDANLNMKINNIENAKFICDDAKNLSEKIKADVIVVDPPRKGLSSKTIESILSIFPKRIVYISCNPSTLARDLSLFSQSEYEIEKITPINLFPRSYHVETVVLMSRGGDNHAFHR